MQQKPLASPRAIAGIATREGYLLIIGGCAKVATREAGRAVHRRQRLIGAFLAGMLAFFIAASWASTYFVDWLWFQNLGYASVFWRTLGAKWAVGLAGGLAFGLIIFSNLWVAARDGVFLPPNVIPFPYYRWIRPRGILAAAALVGLFFGVMAGLSLSGQWLTVLLFLKRTSFGVADPLFHRDVGFFVFTLPVLTLVYQLLSTALVLSLLLAGAFYGLTGKISVSGPHLTIHPRARSHLFALLGAFLLVRAGGYVLAMYRLVYSPRGVAFGASYTDVYAELPALKVLAVACAAVAAVALASISSRNYRLLGGGIAALVALSFIMRNVVPGVVQQLVVKPNEIAKETPYIQHNIRYTRAAYNLDRIEEREFPAADNLTVADLVAQRGTIDNIRLWDWRILESAYQQLQGIRRYYVFNDVDVDRYELDGRQRQVVVAAREIDYRQLPERTWINQHLKYTHGYGIVMSPVAEVTREGLPSLWVRDIPPTATPGVQGALAVREPRIYFGERTEPYAIVRTAEEEFDYPQGDKNTYTSYAGRGGIPIGGVLPRLAFAMSTGDYNVLFSRAITGESRVLLHREVDRRADRIAPFLLYDRDPYLVLADGRLFWVLDAYTVSGSYPYSEPIDIAPGLRINYMRNSVKVVVDAYHGDVTFYVADPEDPLVRAYQRVFPELFRPLDQMPAPIRVHLRYPEDLFRVQALMYAKYHMQDPVVFYNKEDLWQQPREIVGTVGSEPQPVEPYYVIMQLPGEDRPEFLLMMPYTPSTRQNMIAWLAARSDGERYGKLLVYKFSKQKVVFGPEQVEALITQNDAVAEKITLWSQQGSTVQRGNLLVIPIKDSILYVEPLYLQSATTKLPELRRVVAVYGNRVVMEESLGAALSRLFGTDRPAGPASPGTAGDQAGLGAPAAPPGMGALIDEANRLYTQAQEALRRGDWAGYGERIGRLGDLLREMRQRLP